MRILLVEDDRGTAAFLHAGLASEGFTLDLARSGADALGRSREAQLYGAIVLDLVLPDMEGLELCRRWREQKVLIPILMMSARDTVRDRVRGLDAGADDYLVKPFAFEELVARIRALCRREQEFRTGSRLRTGDLVLDVATREAWRAGRPLELTAKEFALLHYLMQRSDRALSRTMIEENVWGFRHDCMTNVVDVYIRRLRRKIGEDKPPRRIRTVRGFGYRLQV